MIRSTIAAAMSLILAACAAPLAPAEEDTGYVTQNNEPGPCATGANVCSTWVGMSEIYGQCINGTCCTGCVTARGVCVTGSAENACGRGGGLCQNCDDENPCTADACVGPGYCTYLTMADSSVCGMFPTRTCRAGICN